MYASFTVWFFKSPAMSSQSVCLCILISKMPLCYEDVLVFDQWAGRYFTVWNVYFDFWSLNWCFRMFLRCQFSVPWDVLWGMTCYSFHYFKDVYICIVSSMRCRKRIHNMSFLAVSSVQCADSSANSNYLLILWLVYVHIEPWIIIRWLISLLLQ